MKDFTARYIAIKENLRRARMEMDSRHASFSIEHADITERIEKAHAEMAVRADTDVDMFMGDSNA